VDIGLSAGFNFFYGSNGAGKTAILEAVHLLGRGRSFRSANAAELIGFGRDALVVRVLAEDEHLGSQRVVYARGRSGNPEVRINGESGRRMSQVAALFPLEVMTPTLVDLVFGGPAARREWLDWGVFHVKHDYLPILRRYLDVLRQRNACLKSVAVGAQPMSALEPWTDELARLGVLVDRARREHLDDMVSRVVSCLNELSGGFDVQIAYRQGWNGGADLAKVLGENLPREVKSGTTMVGPHRAEVELLTKGQSCAATLSRGQAKVLASALMLAQSDAIGEKARRKGFFLVDDIGAELDANHRYRLFGALVRRDCQVFATAVEVPDADLLAACPAHALFHVEHGAVAGS
jgi:DNA replication and repair protein RecF